MQAAFQKSVRIPSSLLAVASVLLVATAAYPKSIDASGFDSNSEKADYMQCARSAVQSSSTLHQ